MSMQITKPVPGEFYRHFKGRLYQIKMLAKDAEDGRDLVVYQAMYPPFTCFVRSLVEFLSPVDLKKYPDSVQKMRFVRVAVQEKAEAENARNTAVQSAQGRMPAMTQSLPKLTDEELEKALCYGNIEKFVGSGITEDELQQRGLMMFLDADNFRKKRQIFIGLGPYLNSVLLNNIAVTLDLVLEEEEEEAQYDAILKCLGALEHYEGGRLR